MAHDSSSAHVAPVAADVALSQPPYDCPLKSAVIHMSTQHCGQMQILFRSALYLTIQERSFRYFSSLIELQQVNGMKVGKTYKSDIQENYCGTYCRQLS